MNNTERSQGFKAAAWILPSLQSREFGGDIDVSTTEGAIGAIPIGFTYLMLAPFPWEATSFRSSITIPEVLVWWAMLPFMVYGIMWSIKNRLREELSDPPVYLASERRVLDLSGERWHRVIGSEPRSRFFL